MMIPSIQPNNKLPTKEISNSLPQMDSIFRTYCFHHRFCIWKEGFPDKYKRMKRPETMQSKIVIKKGNSIVEKANLSCFLQVFVHGSSCQPACSHCRNYGSCSSDNITSGKYAGDRGHHFFIHLDFPFSLGF